MNFLVETQSMNFIDIILYVIVPPAVIVPLLIWFHNWVLGRGEPNPFKHSVIELTLTEQIVVYLIVAFVPILLIFWLASPPVAISGLVAIGVTILSSLLIIPSLKSLLEKMRENSLSLGFLIGQDFWLILSSLLLTELASFSWMVKEETIYFYGPFLQFTVAYFGLLMLIGIFLGIPKQNGLRKFPKDWRFGMLIGLDPIIILSVTWIFVQMVASIILPLFFK